MLSGMLEEKNINVVPEFMVEQVEPEKKVIISYEEEEVPYDLLITANAALMEGIEPWEVAGRISVDAEGLGLRQPQCLVPKSLKVVAHGYAASNAARVGRRCPC